MRQATALRGEFGDYFSYFPLLPKQVERSRAVAALRTSYPSISRSLTGEQNPRVVIDGQNLPMIRSSFR